MHQHAAGDEVGVEALDVEVVDGDGGVQLLQLQARYNPRIPGECPDRVPNRQVACSNPAPACSSSPFSRTNTSLTTFSASSPALRKILLSSCRAYINFICLFLFYLSIPAWPVRQGSPTSRPYGTTLWLPHDSALHPFPSHTSGRDCIAL